MIQNTLLAARDLGRLYEIASILIRFGFGDMVRRLGMGTVLEKAGKVLHWQEAEELARLEPAARIRCAIEELGPGFVKLGQVLSTRIDLFPPEYIAEFAKLQDQVPPLPFEDILAQLERDIGGAVDDVFASVDKKPLAAASIAQVHRATLKSGDEVVLKIRRPGVHKVIDADLRLLARLAEVAEESAEELRQFQPQKIAAEFAKSIHSELDLANECKNAERIAKNFKTHPDIVIPKVYWEYASESLNVQQFIDGIAGSDLDAVDAAGLDRKKLAVSGANAVMKMVFEDRFFHADPHPGNVIYLPGNRIAFIDFGMAGRLSDDRRTQLVDLLFAIVQRDAAGACKILLHWSGATTTRNDTLTGEIDDMIDKTHGVPLKQLRISELMNELIALLRAHNLSLPPDLTMLSKAFISLEGMGRQLDPDYDMIAQAEPFLRKQMLNRISPKEVLKRGRKGLADGFEIMTELPKDTHDLVKTLQSGHFRFNMKIDDAESFLDRIDKVIARLIMGIVIAALIMGSSIVMTVSGSEIPLGLSVFAMLGFFGAVIGALYLLYTNWRGR
ncbi:AarF/UbiB family protein [Profundibacter sp.]